MWSRRRRLGKLPQQEQSEAGADHIHRGATPGPPGQLPAGLQPGRTGPGADSADHRTQQASHSSMVPEQQSTSEETPQHWQDQVFTL